MRLATHDSRCSGSTALLGSLFSLSFDTRFLVMFAPAQFRQNTILLYFPGESLEQTVKALVVSGFHFSQVASHPFRI